MSWVIAVMAAAMAPFLVAHDGRARNPLTGKSTYLAYVKKIDNNKATTCVKKTTGNALVYT